MKTRRLFIWLLCFFAPIGAGAEVKGLPHSKSPLATAKAIHCEMILRRPHEQVPAIRLMHSRLVGSEFNLFYAQGSDRLFQAVGLENVSVADLERLRLSVRENLHRNNPLAEQGDYIASFKLDGDKDPVTETGFSSPPVVVWKTHMGTAFELENYLNTEKFEYKDLQPLPGMYHSVGGHLRSSNSLRLYLATFEYKAHKGVVFVEIGTYLPCTSKEITKQMKSHALRNIEGYICQVPILSFARKTMAVGSVPAYLQ